MLERASIRKILEGVLSQYWPGVTKQGPNVQLRMRSDSEHAQSVNLKETSPHKTSYELLTYSLASNHYVHS